MGMRILVGKKALKKHYEELTAFLQVVDGTEDSAASLLKEAKVTIIHWPTILSCHVEINIYQLKDTNMTFDLQSYFKHLIEIEVFPL